MKTSTKILAGLSTALILGGAGTATYFGMRYNHLNNEHAQYVVAQEKENKDLASKVIALQEALEDQAILKQELAIAKANSTANAERVNELTAQLEAKNTEIERLNSEIEKLKNSQEPEESEVQDASTYTNLSFTYNEEAKTASVRGNDSSMTCVEIPAKVKYNDEVYSVTEIGNFSRYISLKSITLPEGITTISSHAFDMSTQIESINIPASVTTIGHGAFTRSTKTITVDAKNETFYAYESGLYTKADNVLIWGCANTIIKEGTTAIGRQAFEYCSSLTSIDIPASVTSIGEQAFYGCRITQITLPANLTNIGSGAFLVCSQLTMVTFENKVGWQVINTAGETIDISESNLSEENVMTTWGKAEGYEWKRTETTENADNGDSYTPGDLF